MTLKKSVVEQINTSAHKVIENNRQKLRPIIKSTLYRGIHDTSVRGKTVNEGNFVDLLEFRIDSWYDILLNHLETAFGKCKYVSHRIQNELIQICGNVFRSDIITEVNNSIAFSLLANETTDIEKKEQLSIRVWYININFVVREEVLGFTEVQV